MLMFQMFHVTLQSECELTARQAPTRRVLELRVRPPANQNAAPRAPLNLALVLDRSGSMSGYKLDYVKQAARQVIEMLSGQDRVALVSYDDTVTVNLPATAISRLNAADITARIDAILPGGSTNLSGGWMQGCQEIALHAEDSRQVNRVLLLTDGLANVGITDPEILANHARELAQRGVATSTFGVGMGFNEHLLEAMANQGSGNFYFIASPAEIPSILTREFSKLSTVTARSVQVTLTFPPEVTVEVLGDWRHTLEGNTVRLHLGDLPAGRDQEVYLKLLLPASAARERLEIKAFATGSGLNDTDLADETTLTFRYADDEQVANAPKQADVLERFARVMMGDRSVNALKLERAGERDKARDLILKMLDENRPYLPADQVEYYERLAQRMQVGMAEPDRKASQYASVLSRRSREDER